MTGKKLKRKIRRVQSRLEDEFGCGISYRWLLHLITTIQAETETNPTEDELFQKARDEHQERP